MDWNTILTSGPAFAAVGVLATVIFNYFIQKSKGGTEFQITERKTLSDDQEKFKQSILNELKEYRSKVDKLEREATNWQERAIQAQEQKLALTEEIIRLTAKVLELEHLIAELREIISEMKKAPTS